ncbi:DUF1707 SHOCT-like domain-containing protein [Nocardioides limicola]|uniref:DUF1707 SHOCT-like domain-containing protein n=1 Tax=Nocardioides limicola TaxID=2803368 RepID=UPI00193AFECA|nr:DUF1707 domain-containing protein [Nocardioides sp. DJM-14]
MNDPLQLRISDEDRHTVSEVLREAAGEGRLEVNELHERLESAYAAKVYADLVPLLADLPGAGPRLPAVAAGGVPVPVTAAGLTDIPRHDKSFALMGAQDRKGVWTIGAEHAAFTLMGGITLDLREAHFASREVVINANAIMGGIDVICNQWTQISVEGVGIMGDFSQGRDKVQLEVHPGSPMVRVKGVALMGGVSVVRKPMPGEGAAAKWLKRLGLQ